MVAAALVPRVRIMAVCDRVRESKTEAGVFDLKGVRQEITANAFPFVPARLWLFLVLASHRPGAYPGYVRVIDEGTDKTIFYGKTAPTPAFKDDKDFLAGRLQLRCSFPSAGRYTVQVWFFQQHGSDVLKGELPLSLVMDGV
jgi:hypothetical protein